jgi:hypothetical protein
MTGIGRGTAQFTFSLDLTCTRPQISVLHWAATGDFRQTWIPLSGQSSGSYSTLTPKDVFTNTKRRNNLTSLTEG